MMLTKSLTLALVSLGLALPAVAQSKIDWSKPVIVDTNKLSTKPEDMAKPVEVITALDVKLTPLRDTVAPAPCDPPVVKSNNKPAPAPCPAGPR